MAVIHIGGDGDQTEARAIDVGRSEGSTNGICGWMDEECERNKGIKEDSRVKT